MAIVMFLVVPLLTMCSSFCGFGHSIPRSGDVVQNGQSQQRPPQNSAAVSAPLLQGVLSLAVAHTILLFPRRIRI